MASSTIVDTEVRRLSDALRDLIRRKKTSQRQVEKALGQGKSYLSQLLGGNVDLKVKHVFAVLEVLEVPVDEFFQEVYDRSDPVGAVRDLVSRAELDELKNRVARLEEAAAAPGQKQTK